MIDIHRKAAFLWEFYGKYYATVAQAQNSLGDSVNRNAVSLLAVKVADCFSPYCNKVKTPSEKELNTVLSDKS